MCIVHPTAKTSKGRAQKIGHLSFRLATHNDYSTSPSPGLQLLPSHSRRGLGRTQSVYILAYLDETKRVGTALYAGEGKNTRSWVHIEDLMAVYLKLVEAAVAGGGGADWGREVCPPFAGIQNRDHVNDSLGYYFVASSEASQLDFARAAGKILKAHGIVKSEEPRSLPLEQVDGMMSAWGVPHIETYIFATNSRTRPDRAKKALDYEPKAPSLWDTMEADLLACCIRSEV